MGNPFGWDYPPGVTGNELEIAGPDWEGIEDWSCPNCDWNGKVDVSGYRGRFWTTCPSCGLEDEWYAEELEDDRAYDEWKDRQMEEEEYGYPEEH
jgi:transcription elongation factor Elf1